MRGASETFRRYKAYAIRHATRHATRDAIRRAIRRAIRHAIRHMPYKACYKAWPYRGMRRRYDSATVLYIYGIFFLFLERHQLPRALI